VGKCMFMDGSVGSRCRRAKSVCHVIRDKRSGGFGARRTVSPISRVTMCVG
jgi:hypothetical protein